MERKELIHKNPCMELNDFLEEVDRTGGWPVGFTHVAFYHAMENSGRYCRFTTFPVNTGWWTTVCSSDDYFYWKLSDAAKRKLIDKAKGEIINAVRISATEIK